MTAIEYSPPRRDSSQRRRGRIADVLTYTLLVALSVDKPYVSDEQLRTDQRFLDLIGAFLGQAIQLSRVVMRQKEELLEENAQLRAQVRDRYKFDNIIGDSPAMHEVFSVVGQVANSRATVLLLGETGTGKELLAEAVHRASPRSNQPFVIVDCGAVVPSLIESELFGHAKGAFTGAHAERQGHLVQADGGTVFLDEVGELPLELQPKLLRVLESGTVRRVGDNAAKDVDVRVVAATHRDLKAEVAAGRFRADLYYRLAVVPVRVPALRERVEDIPLLVRHLFQQAGQPDFPLTEELVQRLVGYDWPGNVRELRNFVHRVLAAGDAELPDAQPVSAVTTAEDLSGLTFKEAKERMVEAFTREYLTALLARCGNNISEVARTAGLARSHVHGLLNRYGLKAGD